MQMKIAAQLSGAEQVPPVQTAGTGKFQGTVAGSNSISYRLSFSGLSTPVTAAHIHFGKKVTNGGARRLLLRGWREAAVSAVRGHRHGKDYRGKRHRYRRYETG